MSDVISRQLIWSIAFAILCLGILAAPATYAQQDETTENNPVLVLHSYLIAPARRAGLQQAATKVSLELRFVEGTIAEEILQEEISAARFILLDLPHSSVVDGIVKKTASLVQDSKRPYVLIGDLEQVRRSEPLVAEPLGSHDKVPDEWAATIRKYYRYGGKANTEYLINELANKIPGPTEVEVDLTDAKLFPKQGFYHPDWFKIETDNAIVAQKFADQDNPVAAIAINQAVLTADDTEWLNALIAALSNRGINSYAFYGPRQNAQRFSEMTRLVENGRSRRFADLIINAALVFRPQERKLELDEIGVPVLQTLPSLNADIEKWKLSSDGLPLADVSYYYASSEFAGMVDPILLSARNAKTGMLEPVPQQIAAVADRAKAICQLQRTDPADRRIAIMVYNYPQGENNFGASFLNVPKSLVNVLTRMKEAGYTAETLTEDAITAKIQKSLRCLYDQSSLVAQHAAGEADFFPLDEYKAWFESLPPGTKQRIESYWGTPESMAVTVKNEAASAKGFVIPGVRLGNVLIVPQSLRHEVTTGTEDDLRKKRINHKSTVPLSHTYLATYLFLRQSMQAHALIHFGTHGTLEWAPGKQRALAVDDDPYLALGSLPNFYPYIMDNLGEATTAKRRGRATMISHLTPMFTPAGFRPGLHEMHDLMHDWETVTAGPVKEEMERQLIEQFVVHKLDRDLSWSSHEIADDFEGFMEVLHPFLDDIAQTAQPQGLAVLGEIPSPERRFGMVMQMLRSSLIDALGEDIDEVFLLDSEKVANSRPARWLRMALVDPEAASRLDLRQVDQLDSTKKTSVPNRSSQKKLDPVELLNLAKEAQRLDQALSTNNEIVSLLAALDGKHVPSSYGGDPVRNPDSLPTGRNIYGFDPTRVPTQQAWEIGVGVLDSWIGSYLEEHAGEYPEQIAFTMWAGETMRHHGVMESQVFHALGVRPQWNSSGRMTGIELVPINQLKRPRIDVLLSVTGSYRDQFPHLMKWIDEAVVLVAQQEDSKDQASSGIGSTNFVAKHVQSLQEELEASGVSTADAMRQATARVFSNESGNYGTGLNDAVYGSDLWKSQKQGGGDQEMANLFVARMGFAYGEGLDGVASSDLFAKQISRVDAAFLSRSSNTYGVLTSDDPFAYLGGFALAARAAGQKPPELYVQNLRDESEVIVDRAAAAIAKEMQTRYLHPHWIRAQQAEGYSGTLQVLKATQFLWGWQVTAPETVRQDQWQSMMDVFVADDYNLGTRQWLEQDNQQALAQILERMVDAVRLDYWQPDAETKQTLFAAYEEARKESGLIESNQLVAQFVSTQRQIDSVSKPDLASSSVGPVSPDPSLETATSQPTPQSSPSAPLSEYVSGQQLRPTSEGKEETYEIDDDHSSRSIFILIMLVGLALAGALIQSRRFVRNQGENS